MEYQKSVQLSVQDDGSLSIHFQSIQPNTQNYASTHDISIIEAIRTHTTQGLNDQESQLHAGGFKGMTVVQATGQNQEIKGSSGSDKENVC